MSATALVSGGKDSIFAAYLADAQGMDVDELLVLVPDDVDAMLFHTPNLGLVRLQAEAWGKRFRSVRVPAAGEAAETAALEAALAGGGATVVAGAIASSYQWTRLLRAADRLGRRLFVPLWGKEAANVVRAEIDAGLDIRLVQVAAEPLDAGLLGARLDLDLLDELARRSATRRPVHLAGEGGEYETLVVDAPFFARRLALGPTRRVDRGGAWRLDVERAELADKPSRASS